MREDIFENASMAFDTARILVAGIGGGGCNTIKYMITNNLSSVEFLCLNTDIKDLAKVSEQMQLPIGKKRTNGLGAGGNPDVGRESAIEDKEVIAKTLEGADMLFITAGMGGGTGTGAAPVVAEVAKELGILTVAVVTTPFKFEGARRNNLALKGVESLKNNVDSMIVIANEKLLENELNMKMQDAFAMVNDVLLNAVRGISELISRPGEINVDFADVSSVMRGMGMSVIGTGYSAEDNAAMKAVEQAISSPLLDNVKIDGARGILVNVTSNGNLSISDYQEICEKMESYSTDESNLITGMTIDPDMDEAIRVTVVLAGVESGFTLHEHKPANKKNGTDDTETSEQIEDVASWISRQMD